MEGKMPIDIDKVLSFEGNKYEMVNAMIKYAFYLSQKNEDSLEVNLGNSKEKITTVAINDVLNGKIKYTYEESEED